MSSSGLDWQPLLQAWLRTRPHYEQPIISDLFAKNFLSLFTWCKQNLRLCIPILQVNVITQVCMANILFCYFQMWRFISWFFDFEHNVGFVQYRFEANPEPVPSIVCRKRKLKRKVLLWAPKEQLPDPAGPQAKSSLNVFCLVYSRVWSWQMEKCDAYN